MEFIKSPNLPTKQISCAIMQKAYDFPFNIIEVSNCENLNKIENSHADMQIIHLGENLFVCEDSVFEYYSNTLNNAKIYRGIKLQEKYPYNISFNACIIGKKLFCYEKYTDTIIIELANKLGLKIINTKQGYTKCSTAIVNENSVITSDKGLYETYLKEGLDVLLIKEGNILLPGYDYGFIGGCCGKISNDTIWFNGNIEMHPDYQLIKNFCESNGCKINYSVKAPLTDIGSILPIF